MGSSLKRKRETERKSWSQSSSKWTTLGRDTLVEEITRRLRTRTRDILHLRAVCEAWRSLVPTPTEFICGGFASPLEIPYSIHDEPAVISQCLLKQNTIYCLQPSEKIYNALSSAAATATTWFLKIEETESGKVRLKDPLCRGNNLMENNITSDTLPKVVNLLDYKVVEVGKEYFLESHASEVNWKIYEEMNKVVVGEIENKEGDDDQIMVMTMHFGGFLRVWKVGQSIWTEIRNGTEAFHDIVYHNGCFCAVDGKGLTVNIDSSSFGLTEVAPPPPPSYRRRSSPGPRFNYLVSSLGELYMVIKYIYVKHDSPDFEVFRLDEERGKWVVVRRLRDRVLFVGDGCSFSVRASEFGGCKENCIYIRHGRFHSCPSYPGSDAGLFDLVDDTAKPLRSVVGYPKIFWPPPTWLKQTKYI